VSEVDAGEMLEAGLVSVVADYREKLGLPSEELTLVLPCWLYDKVGPERLRASFKRLGIGRVELTDGFEESDRAQMLLYASGTWHAGHGIGETRQGCEGCEHTP
jgi:hypothetical protein